MPNWLRKSLVVMVTILTFGLVTPSQAFLYEHSNAVKTPKKDIFDALSENKNVINNPALADEHVGYISKEDFIRQMLMEAEAQSFTKFGARIKPVIENEFTEVILPNIEKAIQNVAEQYPEEELAYLTVTERPGKGHSEKIFNITNDKTNEDVIRFHVRRDQPPQQGYWFNFHYHTHHDQFQAHHELGSIYWDKNTPPKWMS
ncbi:YpjP family protein [Bacillus sp. DTU_2020_1000418_1_SI_GHA_SEK_038]|uniref:YpjP family protein n=1 Tax=Bacillus sp. DTU_2020_1000418_1_SI_GHA_SEK_038 TaxID=3077585 RepID=UPI0028EB5F2A|nr:YpjP family protein [Bacillus sp. DTU_2020_1000418_1_SI_GHA_SEK_038]WNS73924.1 YpjP family protein [Bacillus sp. DTU_2020_1000418_1_SI_GHA_SEK_038]